MHESFPKMLSSYIAYVEYLLKSIALSCFPLGFSNGQSSLWRLVCDALTVLQHARAHRPLKLAGLHESIVVMFRKCMSTLYVMCRQGWGRFCRLFDDECANPINQAWLRLFKPCTKKFYVTASKSKHKFLYDCDNNINRCTRVARLSHVLHVIGLIVSQAPRHKSTVGLMRESS